MHKLNWNQKFQFKMNCRLCRISFDISNVAQWELHTSYWHNCQPQHMYIYVQTYVHGVFVCVCLCMRARYRFVHIIIIIRTLYSIHHTHRSPFTQFGCYYVMYRWFWHLDVSLQFFGCSIEKYNTNENRNFLLFVHLLLCLEMSFTQLILVHGTVHCSLFIWLCWAVMGPIFLKNI